MKRISITVALLILLNPLVFSSTATRPPKIIIPLRHGYTVVMDTSNIDGHTRLTIIRDGKTIFKDSNEQYRMKDEVYPFALHFGLDHDEILLRREADGSSHEVIRLFVVSGFVKRLDSLPAFLRGASDLAGDGVPRFAGFGEVGQRSDSAGNERERFNPIFYYVASKEGLLVDSVMTKTVNERIFGSFHELGYYDQHPQSETLSLQCTKELMRIMNAPTLSLDGF